jgi:hypothetical protein
MAVPTSFVDLSTTPASNSPQGSESVFPDLDNHLRALYAFLASIKGNSGNGWASPYLTVTSPATISGTLGVSSGGTRWATFGAGAAAGSFAQFYKGGTTTQIAYIGSDGGGAVAGGTGDNFAIRAEGDLYLASGASIRVVAGSTGTVTINAPTSGVALTSNAVAGNLSGLFVGGPVRLYTTTVNALLSAVTAGAGARGFVTDATDTTFASAVAAGGSNAVPVYSDGTVWRIG